MSLVTPVVVSLCTTHTALIFFSVSALSTSASLRGEEAQHVGVDALQTGGLGQVRFPTLRQAMTSTPLPVDPPTWVPLAPVAQHPSITQPPALHQP